MRGYTERNGSLQKGSETSCKQEACPYRIMERFHTELFQISRVSAASKSSSVCRHLNSVHVLDENGASQARVQGYVVKDLEERVSNGLIANCFVTSK